MNSLEKLKTKEIALNHLVYNRIKLYKECIEMLQAHDPNGEYWAIIFEHGNDYDKAMQVVQECVAMSLQMAIQDKEKDAAKVYIKVLREAIKY